MKYILLIGLLLLSACGSTPNRCNQKIADASHLQFVDMGTLKMTA